MVEKEEKEAGIVSEKFFKSAGPRSPVPSWTAFFLVLLGFQPFGPGTEPVPGPGPGPEKKEKRPAGRYIKMVVH